MDNHENIKADLIAEIKKRVLDKILEQTNADLLIKLINNADSLDEAINIAALGTTYKRTGLHFDKRLEKMGDSIKYFKKNAELSFRTDDSKPTHKLIIGDNYEALQNLLIQYKGKINVIYIDPPYGKDSMGEFAQTNYNNAITRDNLLSMLYPRLQLAKQLLSDEGVIFCSIDDKNQAYLKLLFDEIFGEENFVSCIIWQKGNAQNDADTIQSNCEYIVCYARNLLSNPIGNIEQKVEVSAYYDEYQKKYYYEGSGLTTGGAGGTLNARVNLGYSIYYNPKTKDFLALDDYDKELAKISNDESKVYKNDINLINKGYKIIRPPKKGVGLGRWTWSLDKFNDEKERILIKQNGDKFSILKKEWLDDKQIKKDENNEFYATITKLNPPKNFIDFIGSGNGSKELQKLFNAKIFTNPKPTKLIQHLAQISTSKDDIILDFFAGSGTTGHAVLDLNKQDGGNRTFILCQLNEKTDTTPNGIAYDVTSKRLKRIMGGECYDGSKDFKWLEKNEPYGGNLDVYEIGSVANFEWNEGKTPFDVIDETLYGKEKFSSIKEKIEWVCGNFDKTQKYLQNIEE